MQYMHFEKTHKLRHSAAICLAIPSHIRIHFSTLSLVMFCRSYVTRSRQQSLLITSHCSTKAQTDCTVLAQLEATEMLRTSTRYSTLNSSYSTVIILNHTRNEGQVRLWQTKYKQPEVVSFVYAIFDIFCYMLQNKRTIKATGLDWLCFTGLTNQSINQSINQIQSIHPSIKSNQSIIHHNHHHDY